MLVVAELRIGRARRGAVVWGAALGALSALMVALYPTFSEDLSDIVESLPADLRAAFGIESYDTPRAFIDGEMYTLLIPISVALFAIREVARNLAGHEERAWLDVELTTPAGRRALVVGSYLAAIASTALVAAITALITWVAGLLAGADVGAGPLAQGALAVWLLAAGLAAVALVLCARFHRSAPVVAGAAATLVAMYVIDLAGTLVDALEPFRVVSVFDHYGSPVRDGIGLDQVAVMALMASSLALAATLLFERHDVRG